ncbi:MAG: helix-turn-helix domain-containing protein [Bifidobacteriaceae bacterium]|nr:helix-turn-helix domain-containing protein [Bifidobacteriaceae bacterium]
MSTRGRKAGPVSKALGRAIWDAAREAGFTTKTALAASAGLPEPTLNQITNGRRVADPEQLARIAQALGTRGSVIMARAEAILDTEPGEG